MQLIRGLHNLTKQTAFQHGCVLAIGNFDGVHLGHQQILHRLREKSQQLGLPSVVMIFEPQPREFFAKTRPDFAPPARLMRLRDKWHALNQMQIDYLLCVRFNREFAELLPEQFIQQLLVEKLHVRYLSVGDDFHFGANRSGNFATLKAASEQFGFEIENSDSHCLGKDRISSSLIRQALKDDNLELAEQLLGKPYAIRGRVAHGNKLGRTIGFPTANVPLNRLVTAIQGVYAVQVETALGRFNGIANVGNRPTINGTKPLLEVHLFEFDASIYGQGIEVRFLQKVRAETKFDSFDDLKQQIARDVVQVKHFFGM